MTELKPPAEIAYLVDVIGFDATLKLIETYGGTRLYIPRAYHLKHRLVEEFGKETVRAMIRSWGNESLKVPVCRWWRIRYYRQHNMSYPLIARKVGCTETTVWRSLNAADMVERQLALPID